MPTLKTRVNVSLSNDTRDALMRLARKDRIPWATKAARLIEIALDLEEDNIWNAIAESRDTKGARFVSHSKAWN